MMIPVLLLAMPKTLAPELHALRAVPIEEEQTDVPPDVRLLLKNAKSDLRTLVSDAVAQQKKEGHAAAVSTENAIVSALDDAGIDIVEDSSHYGDITSVDVQSPRGHKDLLAVEIDFAIPCGSDAVYFLFRHEKEWQLVLQRQSDDYETISQALGSFNAEVSSSDASGRFIVLTTSISPWCVSNWQTLRYQVDRVEPRGKRPLRIDEGETGIFLGDDYYVQTTSDSYTMRFDAESIDPDIVARPYVLSFRIDGDKPVRVEPIADSPRDFVEEWLQMSDADAGHWSTLDASALAGWRSRLFVGQEQYAYNRFDPVGRCADDGVWQIALNRSLEEDGPESTYYFIVSSAESSYRMLEIREEPRAGCETPPPQ